MKNRISQLVITVLPIILLASCGKPTEETKPVRKDVTETVFASGVLEADGSYNLTAQTDGYLIQVSFKEGDVVKEGTVLAIVDNKANRYNTESSTALYKIAESNLAPSAPALMQSKNSVTVAKQNLQLDSLQYARYKKLMESESVSRLDFENAQLKYNTSLANYKSAVESYKLQKQAAEQAVINNQAEKEKNRVVFGNNEIRAVVTGKVYKKHKEKGDYVKKGDVIAEIGDASFIYAKVNVDESNIAKVKVGQEAVIQLNTNKEKKYNAIVSEINPSFDEADQSFICKLVFKDTLDFKIINTQLQSNIVVGVIKNALVIPRNYINYGNLVTVKGKDKPVSVETQIVSNKWVLIKSGVTENDILVTDKIAANEVKGTDSSH